jgi:hypothetical protein
MVYVEYVRTLRLGPGIAPDTDIGSLIGDCYRHKVKQYYEEVKAGTCWVNDRQRRRAVRRDEVQRRRT